MHRAVYKTDWSAVTIRWAVRLAAPPEQPGPRSLSSQKRKLEAHAEHSDPAKLKHLAEQVTSQTPADTLAEQRARVQELMQQMKEWPSESELLLSSLLTVNNSTAPEPDKVVALKFMHELVEQVDVANGVIVRYLTGARVVVACWQTLCSVYHACVMRQHTVDRKQ